MQKHDLFEIIATAIIIKDGKFLITRRSTHKKRFPGMWTVPGGHVEIADYQSAQKDKKGYWREVLEHALRREIKEEVGLEVENIRYLTSCASFFRGEDPTLVISCVTDYKSGDVVLQKDEADKYAWVTLDEAGLYILLDGILDELALAQEKYIKPKSQTLF